MASFESDGGEFKIELDVAEDTELQWTTQEPCPGAPCDRAKNGANTTMASSVTNSWSPPATVIMSDTLSPTDDGQGVRAEAEDHCVKEGSPYQPLAVYSTEQPMADNTSGSLLSLDTSHICHYCFAEFALVSSLELHLASVHGKKLHVVLPEPSTPYGCDAGNCDNANMDVDADSYGKRHMTTQSDFYDNGSGENGQKTSKMSRKNCKSYACDVCDKAFTRPYHLETHKRIHTKQKPFVCDECFKSFRQAGHLNRHKLTHSGLKPFVCDVCKKSYTQANNLKEHKLTHSEEKPHKCPHCDREFKQPRYLQNHIKSVHERASGRPFVCDVCGASFPLSGDFTYHKRIHTGERPFVCPECGKAFTQPGHLAQHRQTHTGETPFVCSDCGKAFSRASNLEKHRLTHTGEKPHVCSSCGRGFAQASSLKYHQLTHTGEKPHVCTFCWKRFGDSSSLKNHRRLHTGDKPYSCPHCPAVFSSSQGLRRHVQTNHP